MTRWETLQKCDICSSGNNFLLTFTNDLEEYTRTTYEKASGYRSTEKVQNRLSIRTVWSGPSLSTCIIIGYCRIYRFLCKGPYQSVWCYWLIWIFTVHECPEDILSCDVEMLMTLMGWCVVKSELIIIILWCCSYTSYSKQKLPCKVSITTRADDILHFYFYFFFNIFSE